MAWICSDLFFSKLRCLLLCLLIPFTCSSALAQDCNIPFLSRFDDANTSGFTMHWDDTNFDPVYWEIEFGPKGFIKDQVADLSNIQDRFYEFSGLMSGFTYEIYLRAVCDDDQISDWNGPYFYSTVIDNDTACGLNLGIQDNNCPSENQFSILVEGFDNTYISSEMILDFVAINITHSWPPDLNISIISPSGKRAILASHVGNGIDNFGDPQSPLCSKAVKFTYSSCTAIQDAIPPLMDEYLPVEDINEIFNGELINGIWKIAICDKALGDVGSLNYVHLDFSEQECPQVRNFKIVDIEADHLVIKWDNTLTCNDVRLEYRKKEAPLTETFIEYVPCNREEFIIPDLESNSDYILHVFSECSEELESLPICEISFRTTCNNSSFSADFESNNICSPHCEESCLNDSVWHNLIEEDDNNWQVFSGPTQSAFTGPLRSLRDCGNYLYAESSLECNSNSPTLAILESNCLQIIEQTVCHVSFHYSARADKNSFLSLEISNNNSNWKEVWKINGSNIGEWQFEQIELEDQLSNFRLRFISNEIGTKGMADFALDQIKLIGIDTISFSKFYLDEDQDGYGSVLDSIYVCSNIPPQGYSDNSQDCDDSNNLTNPMSIEIGCNGIDDNCNGSLDDVSFDLLRYSVSEIGNTSCEGKLDGYIDIEIESALLDITFLWSNGLMTEDISGLASGFYFCTISTGVGCTIITDPIQVEATQSIEYGIESILEPNCSETTDGSISLAIEGGVTPYSISWSNGMQGQVITNLEAGSYFATITDDSNCVIITDEIVLANEQVLTVGVISLKNLSCFNSGDGLIRIGAFGGASPYQFLWQDGVSGSLRNQLDAGIYNVTITDANNCKAIIKNIVIEEPENISIEILSIDHVTCFGGYDSYIDVSVKGGTLPYSFIWSDGSSDEDLLNKKAGIYSLTVTDINSCSSADANVVVRETEPISIVLDSINNLRCIGSDNGYISVDVSDGNPPYRYNWNIDDGESTDDNFIEKLKSGRYSLTVEDSYGCKSKIKNYDVINNNQAINISLLVGDSLSCYDDANGTLIAVSNNGMLPLDYNWSAGRQVVRSMFSDTIDNLVFGKYNLTITDSEGCVGVSDSILLENPAELRFELEKRTDVTCFNQDDGLIELEIFGGVTPYSILWSNGMFGNEISNLEPGRYGATIIDNNDCLIFTNEFFITQPDSLSISVVVINDNGMMNGEIHLDVLGGISPYTFLWNENNGGIYNDSIASNLSPGDYMVTILDRNLCEKQLEITVDIMNSVNYNLQLHQLNIYPNPTIGIVNFNFPESWHLRNLKLFDIDGQLLMDNTEDSLSKHLDLTQDNNIREGLYIFQFNFGRFTVTRKVLFLESF